MENPFQMLITGEHDLELLPHELSDGRALAWNPLSLLRFERLAVGNDLIRRIVDRPFDWVLFSSPRAVSFWTETLIEHGVDFPVETQVACVGQKTSEVAAENGFNPDFYPTEPGSEGFLLEFRALIENNLTKPSLFIPMAEGGRSLIEERLKEWGCEVVTASIYRTLPVVETPRAASLEPADGILFTSPSSVDAFFRFFSLPQNCTVISLGRYTSSHLEKKGVSHRILPDGDFERIDEVLCEVSRPKDQEG